MLGRRRDDRQETKWVLIGTFGIVAFLVVFFFLQDWAIHRPH